MQILKSSLLSDIFKHVHIDRAPGMGDGGVSSIFFEMGAETEGVGLEILGTIPFIYYEP